MLKPLKEYSSCERQELIKNSYLASLVKRISKPDGFEKMMKEKLFSADEINYILFHINDLDKISKLYYHEFKIAVANFNKGDS